MKVRIFDVLVCIWAFVVGGIVAFLLFGCVPLEDLHKVAHVAEQVDSVIHAVSADGPTDWAGIIETVGYSVAGIAALVGGGEAIRRKRKKTAEVVAPKKRKKNV